MKREGYISDAQVIRRARAAVSLELEKKRALDIPIAVLDRESRAIYEIHSDGKRVPIQRIRKGRYSERVGKKA